MPGRKFSTTTSIRSISLRQRSRCLPGRFRSMPTPYFPRFKPRKEGCLAARERRSPTAPHVPNPWALHSYKPVPRSPPATACSRGRPARARSPENANSVESADGGPFVESIGISSYDSGSPPPRQSNVPPPGVYLKQAVLTFIMQSLITLTFDDGLRCQFEKAVPILDSYGMPATFFLIANRELTHELGQ